MDTVRDERWKFIGGSDLPVIMGISPFKTRWELLLEKAQLKENDFEGNEYTEYGNMMEPIIRYHINSWFEASYEPDTKVEGVFRSNCDGYDKDNNSILEIKTTSQVHESLEDYKIYLVQILHYMKMWGCEHGRLAVYERPDDFSEELDVERLTVFEVFFADWEDLYNEVAVQINLFLGDLNALKVNPLIEEADLPSRKPLVIPATNAIVLNERIKYLKELEKEYKDFLDDLYEKMDEVGVKSFELNGTKFTRVAPTESKIVSELDKDLLMRNEPELCEKYMVLKEKSGRKGHVRVTFPKEQ